MPKFRVEVSAHALVNGSLVVEAADFESAEYQVLEERLGDIAWSYEGVIEDSAVVTQSSEED